MVYLRLPEPQLLLPAGLWEPCAAAFSLHFGRDEKWNSVAVDHPAFKIKIERQHRFRKNLDLAVRAFAAEFPTARHQPSLGSRGLQTFFLGLPPGCPKAPFVADPLPSADWDPSARQKAARGQLPRSQYVRN